jgi:hypothetical protein
MPLALVRDRQTRRQTVPSSVRLYCDDDGCTLSGMGSERRFPDVQTALDCAGRARDRNVSTIEIWQGGQYVCCVAPRSWERSEADFPSISASGLDSDAALAAAERYANRMARILMATAGPISWLALLVAVIAASLGWQFLLPW